MADGDNPNPQPKPRQKPLPEWLNSPIWSAPAPAPRHRSPPRAPSPPPPPPPQPPRDPDPPPPPPPARCEGAGADDGGGEGAASSSRPHLVAEFKVALGRKVLDLAELRRLACQGVPDAAGVRPVVWKDVDASSDQMETTESVAALDVAVQDISSGSIASLDTVDMAPQEVPDSVEELPDTVDMVPDSVEELPDSVDMVADSLEMVPDTVDPDSVESLCPRCVTFHAGGVFGEACYQARREARMCARCGLLHEDYDMTAKWLDDMEKFDCEVYIPDVEKLEMDGDTILLPEHVIKRLGRDD